MEANRVVVVGGVFAGWVANAINILGQFFAGWDVAFHCDASKGGIGVDRKYGVLVVDFLKLL